MTSVPAAAAVPLLVWLKLLLSLAARWITWQGLVLGGAVAIVTRWWFRPRPNLPPGPAPLPVLGNLLALRAEKRERPVHIKLHNWSCRHGPLITIFIGLRPVVVISSVTVMQEMLDRSTSEIQMPWNNHSWTPRPKWEREPLSKSLHRLVNRVIRKFLSSGKFEECVTSSLDSVIARIRSKHGQPFYPAPMMTYLSFDIISNICFSRRFQPEDPEFRRFLTAHLRLNSLLTEKYLEDMTSFPTLHQSAHSGEMDTMKEQLLKFVATETRNRASTYYEQDTPTDLASHILQARAMWFGNTQPSRHNTAANLTDKHVVAFLCDILRAGMDSARLTLCWTLLYLASTEHLQQNCQREIDILLDGRASGIEDCAKLPYTEAVLYEVMRMRPCMPLGSPYTATCNTSLGGYDIPKGTQILLNHWSLSMDPHKWTDPEKFKPERFLDQKGKAVVKPPGWSALAAGQWSCLGEDPFRLQLMLVISSLLHNFNISLHEDDQSDLEPTGGPLWSTPKPYKVVCTPREKRHVAVAWQSQTVDCSHSDPSAGSLGFSSYMDDGQLRQSTLRYLQHPSSANESAGYDGQSEMSESDSTVKSRSTCASVTWTLSGTNSTCGCGDCSSFTVLSGNGSTVKNRSEGRDDRKKSLPRKTWTNAVT